MSKYRISITYQVFEIGAKNPLLTTKNKEVAEALVRGLEDSPKEDSPKEDWSDLVDPLLEPVAKHPAVVSKIKQQSTQTDHSW
jgi:hypothetical protein